MPKVPKIIELLQAAQVIEQSYNIQVNNMNIYR